MRSAPFRRWTGLILTTAAAMCAATTLLSLCAVLLFISVRGLQRLSLEALTQLPPSPGQDGGGLANAVVGTLMIVTLAAAIAIPTGILAGIYVSEVSHRPALKRGARFVTNVLSGIPSIMAGVFVYGALIVTGVVGFSAIAGGMALAVLMVPLIVRTTDEALQQVSQDIRWAAASVGASPAQSVREVILPAALPGILTGIVLAIARAAGETAPLLFTALNSSFFPTSLFEPTPTLSVLIYNFAISPFPPQQSLAWLGALILVALVLVTSSLARWLVRQSRYS